MGVSSSAKAVDFEAIKELVLQQLTGDERARSVAYLDRELHAAGQTELGGQEITVEHPYVVAFVDQRPGANWMHLCRYLVIDPATQAISSIEADRPPVFGVLPPAWQVIWRAQGVDDWRLIPLAPSVS